jgi:hypothetical protein
MISGIRGLKMENYDKGLNDIAKKFNNNGQQLAKRMLKLFPKLINDIYVSDEYYGKIHLLKKFH